MLFITKEAKSLATSQKVNIAIPYDTAIPFLDNTPKE